MGIGTLTMFACGYVAMLAIPDWRQHIGDEAWLNTTLFQVSRATGGEAFSVFFTVGYLTALGVFNVVATAAGARLLFGMGRDELLPRAVFARVNRRWRTPHWSILLICAIEFALGNFANMETLSNLVNYGAMFAFAALNISVVWLYYVRGGGELADGSRLPASRRAAPALPAAARRRAGHHPLRVGAHGHAGPDPRHRLAGRRHRLPAGQDARLPAAASGARPVTPALLPRCFPLLWRPGMSADSMLALNTYDPPRRPSPTRPSEA